MKLPETDGDLLFELSGLKDALAGIGPRNTSHHLACGLMLMKSWASMNQPGRERRIGTPREFGIELFDWDDYCTMLRMESNPYLVIRSRYGRGAASQDALELYKELIRRAFDIPYAGAGFSTWGEGLWLIDTDWIIAKAMGLSEKEVHRRMNELRRLHYVYTEEDNGAWIMRIGRPQGEEPEAEPVSLF